MVQFLDPIDKIIKNFRYCNFSNIYLIKYNLEIIGFFIIKKNLRINDLSCIEYICLIPEYQSKGLGKTILKLIISKINSNNLELYVDRLNPKAIHLYKKFGFQTKGFIDKWMRMVLSNIIKNHFIKVFMIKMRYEEIVSFRKKFILDGEKTSRGPPKILIL